MYTHSQRLSSRLSLASGLALVLVSLTVGCDNAEQAPAKQPVAAAPSVKAPELVAPANAPKPPAGPLTRVEGNLVCMVNNQYMGQAQIPIVAEGRTYYGCCEMCKGRLAKDPTSRVAVDPISQKPVDKSLAVIGKAANGDVAYFENEANLSAYSKRSSLN